MTKTIVAVLVTLFAADAHAEKIACTTGLTVWEGASKPKPKICGAVSVDAVRDNGVKYRRKPRFCNDFVVEFLSIRKGDKPDLTALCGRSHAPNCYVVRIRDEAKRQGMGYLTGYAVFPSIQLMPTQFSFGASGVGYNTKPLKPKLAKRAHIELSCRKTR